MPYIYRSHDNHYQPSENLKNLFEELIIKPFEHDLPTLAADVKNNRIYYWEEGAHRRRRPLGGGARERRHGGCALEVATLATARVRRVVGTPRGTAGGRSGRAAFSTCAARR